MDFWKGIFGAALASTIAGVSVWFLTNEQTPEAEVSWFAVADFELSERYVAEVFRSNDEFDPTTFRTLQDSRSQRIIAISNNGEIPAANIRIVLGREPFAIDTNSSFPFVAEVQADGRYVYTLESLDVDEQVFVFISGVPSYSDLGVQYLGSNLERGYYRQLGDVSNYRDSLSFVERYLGWILLGSLFLLILGVLAFWKEIAAAEKRERQKKLSADLNELGLIKTPREDEDGNLN